MKIVKYGKVEPRLCECNGCHAQLEYSPYDVKKHPKYHRKDYYVICPICGKAIFVEV